MTLMEVTELGIQNPILELFPRGSSCPFAVNPFPPPAPKPWAPADLLSGSAARVCELLSRPSLASCLSL